MKRFSYLALSALALSLTLPAQPARAEEAFKKCTGDFQTCTNEIIKQLQKRGWIGISLSQVEDRIVVAGMAQEGPARKAGFKEGDVILSLNGTPYKELTDLAKAHAKFKVGDILNYKVRRDGKEQELDVLLTEATSGIIGLWLGEYVIQHYTTVEKDMVKIP